MEKNNIDRLVARNSLIPLVDLETSPVRPEGFSYHQAKRNIESAELEAADFYFNPHNTAYPFCYYRSFILLDLPGIPAELGEVREQINSIENDLNAAVAQRDFARFLTHINRKLAPDIFMEIFDFIPDTDKYPLYENLLNSNELARQVFTEEFKKRAYQYQGARANLPLADEAGYIQIFVTQAIDQYPVRVLTWHTDINIAIRNALQFDPPGDIYQGKVLLAYVRSYVNDKLKNQVVIEPFKVEEIKKLDLIKISEFIPPMQAAGITQQYSRYVRQIKTEWFHNPRGIHALSHTKRVLLMVLMLAYLEDCSEKDTQLLCQAAIYHDIGRKTDGYDTKHGFASYQKMLTKDLLKPSQERAETLRFIVENHAIADISALNQLNKYHLGSSDETIQLYNIFKDADGLDRVRINDLNPKYLRTNSAPRLLMVAHQLYQAQEFEKIVDNDIIFG